MSQNGYHARRAAITLLKMAKTTSDPEMSARFVDVAADLKDHTGELPLPFDPKAPDVEAGVEPSPTPPK